LEKFNIQLQAMVEDISRFQNLLCVFPDIYNKLDTNLIDHIKFLGVEILETKLKQKLLTDTTYKYFQTRSVFHNKSFIVEVTDTLNEIAEKDFEELENILM